MVIKVAANESIMHTAKKKKKKCTRERENGIIIILVKRMRDGVSIYIKREVLHGP